MRWRWVSDAENIRVGEHTNRYKNVKQRWTHLQRWSVNRQAGMEVNTKKENKWTHTYKRPSISHLSRPADQNPDRHGICRNNEKKNTKTRNEKQKTQTEASRQRLWLQHQSNGPAETTLADRQTVTHTHREKSTNTERGAPENRQRWIDTDRKHRWGLAEYKDLEQTKTIEMETNRHTK